MTYRFLPTPRRSVTIRELVAAGLSFHAIERVSRARRLTHRDMTRMQRLRLIDAADRNIAASSRGIAFLALSLASLSRKSAARWAHERAAHIGMMRGELESARNSAERACMYGWRLP